jgi:phospho-N-acetylmuramoyl-pentapeptide-transferase
MIHLLGLLILSFLLTGVLLIPFIDLLYKLRFIRKEQETRDVFGRLTPIFNRFHKAKAGTPVGGGFLVIVIVSLLFALVFPLMRYMGIEPSHVYPIKEEINVLFFTFFSFGLLGLYDDVMKFFGFKKTGVFGLRFRHKFLIQWVLALIIAFLLFFNLKIEFIYIPFFDIYRLGWLYIPLAAFVIVSFVNAVNISDGLDGLASGILLVCLLAFSFLSGSILDTPLSIFMALWIGSLIAFLYFNVYPARIFLGDVGALSFGATLAVIGLLLGKVVALAVIGALFIVEGLSSLLQLVWKRVFRRRLFTVAPFHLWLQQYGWEEPKIVMRAWLASLMLAIFGLFLAMI